MQSTPIHRCRSLFLLAVWIWCLIPLSPQSVDSDFWGHVQYGRDTLQHGLAKTATYTYTSIDFPWVNHENLCEMLFATVVDGLGVPWLLILKCALGGFVLALGMRRAVREQVSVWVVSVVAIVTAWNLSYYWGVRPHMLSFTLFGILIAWTDWCFAGWATFWPFRWPTQTEKSEKSEKSKTFPTTLPANRLWALWLVLPMLVVWTNTHGGFAAGVAVFLAILGGRAVQCLFSTHPQRTMMACHLGILMVLAAVCTLANPYGFELLRWLYYDVSTPRPEIAEWHPPDLLNGASVKWWVLLGVTALGWLSSRRPRDLTHLVVALLVLSQALSHQRHFPFFVLLFLFWMPVHLESAWQRWMEAWRSENMPTLRTLSPVGFQVVTGGLAIACALFAYQLSGRFSVVPVPRNDYPVSAVQFMADRGLTGRLIVSGHWAQYVLCVLGARTPDDRGVQVAFDGRHRTCYPQEMLDLQFDFFAGEGGPDKRYRSPQSPPADPTRILEYRQPDMVLLAHHHQHALSALHHEGTTWTLLYQDQLAQLWGRRTTFDDPEHANYLPAKSRRLEFASQEGTVPWPAAPIRNTTTTFVNRSSRK